MLNINYIRPRKRARVEWARGFREIKRRREDSTDNGRTKGANTAAPSGLRIKRSLKKFKWETPWEEKGTEQDIPFCASRSPSKSRNTNLHYTKSLLYKFTSRIFKAL